MIRVLMLMLMLSTVSCKSYLDLKPFGKLIPETAEDYSSMIHNEINKINTSDETSNLLCSINEALKIEICSDNLDANVYIGQDIAPLYIGGYQTNRDYTISYESIRNCNIILGGLADDNSTLAKTLKGATYAMRGIAYFNLLRSYTPAIKNGIYPNLGMPIVKEFNMEARPIRSSYAELVNFIESDFKMALEYNVEDELYMFTNDVTSHFLTKLYHWTGQWQKAIDVSSGLMSDYQISSRADFKDMITSGNTFSNMILKYKLSSPSPEVDGTQVYSDISKRPMAKKFLDVFADGNQDVRFQMYHNKKRLSIKRHVGALRVEEILLINAEAQYHLKNEQEALNLINSLRENRIENYTPLTISTLPEIIKDGYIINDAKGNPLTKLSSLILDERRRELYMEGDRFFELKRNGSPQMWVSRNGLSYTTFEFMYTSAIPYGDILLTDGLIQNEGYIDIEAR